MNNIKKNRVLLTSVIILIVTWIIYFYKFYEVYSWADFFTQSNASTIVKVVYIFTYYGDRLVPYLVIGFLLLNLNLLVALVIQFLRERKKEVSSIFLWIAIATYCISVSIFLVTTIWPLMLLLVIASLVISYTLYTVYTKKSVDNMDNYENDELIKEAGPFNSQEEATDFFEEFNHEWKGNFEQRNLLLVPKIIQEEANIYHVKIHVKYNFPRIHIKNKEYK